MKRSAWAVAAAGSALAVLLCAAAVTGCHDDTVVPPLTWSIAEPDFWPDLRGYPGVGTGRVVVTNNREDTVSLLDLAPIEAGAPAPLAEVARVPQGFNPVETEGPHHVVADPTGDYYYIGLSTFFPVAGSGPHASHSTATHDGYAFRIRATDNVAIDWARVDPNPGDIRLSPDGTLLLVSHFDLLRIMEVIATGGDPLLMRSELALIDPTTMTRLAKFPICPASHGISVSPDSRTAYVTCYDDGLAVVDLASAAHTVTVVPAIATPGPVTAPLCEPYATTISPAGDSVWVSCWQNGHVLRYDVAAGAMDPAADVVLPGRAVFGTFTRDGATLVVTHQQLDGVAEIDVATATIARDRLLAPADCVNAHAVALTDDEARMMIVCEGDHTGPGSFAVVDRATGATLQSIPLGVFSDGFAVLRRP